MAYERSEPMALRSHQSPHCDLHVLFHQGTVTGLTDGQLMERFVSGGEAVAEQAFDAIVQRHGSLVMRACRAILHDEHDAEDAFQATFVVLVRRGYGLWVRDSLGPWLHRVACRAAGRAKRDAVRRREIERRPAEMATERRNFEEYNGIVAVIHREIDRLPERYRVPVVLCELEGRSYEEAARHLNCPIGTVKSRLARGRERLRAQLTRRGLAPPAILLGLASTLGTESRAAISVDLVASTVRAVLAELAGASSHAIVKASVAALAWQVNRIIIWTRLATLGVVLAIGIATAGAIAAVTYYIEVRQTPTFDTAGRNSFPFRDHEGSVAAVAFSPAG